MIKNSIKIFSVILVIAMGLIWLTSCSSSDETMGNSGSQRSLLIKINMGKSIGGRATDITKDDGNMASNENKITRLTVGIFGSDGNVKTVQELSGASITSTTTGVTAKVVGTAMASGDKILVAVNAPSGKFSVTKESAFKDVAITAEEAITNGTDKTKADNADIPMYGESTLGESNGNLTATVEVKHLLAKVTLASLETNFDANGAYAASSFTPTGFYLINVPNSLKFNDTAWDATVTSWLHGVSDDTSHGTYAEYLATSTLAGTEMKETAASTLHNVLYTMPNANDGDNKTKLVIVGKFKLTANDEGTTMYYPVPLNAQYNEDGSVTAGVDVKYKVYPNKNYNCTVSIRGKGAKTPWEDLSPQSAEITVTVKAFEDVDQTTIFK